MQTEKPDIPRQTLTVVTSNIDGIESAFKKGYFQQPWIENADVLCLQETKSSRTRDIGTSLGYYVAHCDRLEGKHGGVAIFSRTPVADQILPGDGIRSRGQFVSCMVGPIRVASVYVTLDYRPEQYAAFQPLFDRMLKEERAIVAGDFNTFRDARDSWRFAEAYERTELGCDPLAMKWFRRLHADGWINSADIAIQNRPLYTWWWSDRHYGENKGTRLDHQLVTPSLAKSVTAGSGTVHSTVRRGKHAQITISYDLR